MKTAPTSIHALIAALCFAFLAACAPSPEKVCQKLGRLTGGAVGEDEIAECVAGMVELKDEVDRAAWKRLGKCINNASTEDQAVACMLATAMATESE